MTPAGVMRWSGQFLNVHRVPHDEVLSEVVERTAAYRLAGVFHLYLNGAVLEAWRGAMK